MSKTIDSILQAIDYIENNLQNKINVVDVANRACYSIYHFIRLFEGVTGHTPKDYILRRRISESFNILNSKSKKIIDVCFDYQFGSPEVFSRAFKRVVGINPGELKKLDYYPSKSLLEPVDRESIIHGTNLLEAEVEVVWRDNIELLGMVTHIKEDKSIISDIWNYVGKELSITKNSIIKEFIGHSFWSNNYDVNGFFLMCGGVIDGDVKRDSPFCSRKIPASRYLKFTHNGDISSVYLTYKYIFQSYLPKHDYILSKSYDFEVYNPSENGPHDKDAITDIYIPIE